MANLEKVEELMTKHVITVKKGDTVKKVAKTMAADNIGSVIVVEGNKVTGILTERDLSRKIVAKGLDPTKVKVSEVMSSPVTTITPDTSILAATELLDRKKFKKLPVVKDGKLVGIISDMDLISLMHKIQEIKPKAEKKVKGKKAKYELKPGHSYLIKEEGTDKSFDMFVDNVMGGMHGLVITRTHPKRIRNKYGLENTPMLWLTSMTSGEKTISPYNFTELSIVVGKFLNEVENCVILLDGLEYLVTHNSYTQTLKLIQHLRDKISATNSHLIITIDEKSLSQKQLKLLEQEMDIVLSELHEEETKLEAIKDELEDFEKKS